MARDDSFTLHAPGGPPGLAVFSSPHSGRAYSTRFVRLSRLDRLSLRASEDAYVDRLFDTAPEGGAPLLAATAPRAYVDLNRGPNDLDPALIEDARAAGLNPRITAGLGVIPRVVAEGEPIYDGKLPLTEAQRRIERFYTPYHERLNDLMRAACDRYGAAVLFDCHSMPGEALRGAPRIRGRRPEIVLGDRFGASAARSLVDQAEAAFTAAGFTVARNAPFAGGYITQRYGRPNMGWHAIQIEIDRRLYLDEARVRPSPRFEETRARLAPVIAALARSTPQTGALAAE